MHLGSGSSEDISGETRQTPRNSEGIEQEAYRSGASVADAQPEEGPPVGWRSPVCLCPGLLPSPSIIPIYS